MDRLKQLAADAAWTLVPFLVVGALWEIVARSGIYPPKLFPSLVTVFDALLRLTVSGVLWVNTQGTLLRLVLGFFLAAVIGVLLGIAMGRYRFVEDVFLPIVSIGYPIPGLAYAPLFVLWFGLGDLPAVLLVGIASSFSVIINTWKGVKAVNQIWIRAAESMGVTDRQMFYKVILPASLPYIFTGLRLGLAQAWRILVAVEMLTAVSKGLGWMIFGAQEFLATDVMLVGIAMIGVIGLMLEKQVFKRLETYTVVRWGMMTA
jgi:NitT/TauT family transport system permease protein